MAKTRSNRKSGALPMVMVNKGLNVIGATAKGVANKSVPVVEKGVSAVYGTMATGFDLGVKGVSNVAKGIKNMSHKKVSVRRHKKSKKSRKQRKSKKN